MSDRPRNIEPGGEADIPSGMSHDHSGATGPVDDLLASASQRDNRGAHRLSGVFEHTEVTPEQKAAQVRRSRASLATAVALFAVALVVIVTVVGSATGLFERKDYHTDGIDPVNFTVAEGDTTGQVAVNLQNEDVIANASYFIREFTKEHPSDFIQPGTYDLKTQMRTKDVITKLMDKGEATHYAAIAKTQRMDDTFATLSEATGISKSEFEKLSQDKAAFGIPDQFPNIEGWLHPGEYRFPLDATAKDILGEMVDRTKAALEKNGVAEEDWFDVLTVASIVEWEGVPEIYPSVAGAIKNRIENPNGETSGFIQSDASVTYGLGKKTVHITDEEKRDKSNPYNTFAHKGLPVGPIGSPSDEAIAAAANPEDNDYFFWVTVNLDTGETKFAKTYAEHQEYVQEYQQWCEDNEGKCT